MLYIIIYIVTTLLPVLFTVLLFIRSGATSRYPWLRPQFYYDMLQTHLIRKFSSLEWGLNSPPKPHAFVSLPIQRFLCHATYNPINPAYYVFYALIPACIMLTWRYLIPGELCVFDHTGIVTVRNVLGIQTREDVITQTPYLTHLMVDYHNVNNLIFASEYILEHFDESPLIDFNFVSRIIPCTQDFGCRYPHLINQLNQYISLFNEHVTKNGDSVPQVAELLARHLAIYIENFHANPDQDIMEIMELDSRIIQVQGTVERLSALSDQLRLLIDSIRPNGLIMTYPKLDVLDPEAARIVCLEAYNKLSQS